MKISGVETFPIRVGARPFLFVAVDTDEGVYGLGEAALTSRELAVIGFIDHLRPLLVGQDPKRIERLWQSLSRGGFFPADRVGSAAVAALDMALWDIKGKTLGVPCHDLWGGPVRDRVVCYGHAGGDGVEPLVESCLRLKDAGWRFVRWAVPQDGDELEPRAAVRQAVREVEAVRAAVGAEIEIIVDAHTRLAPPDAVTLCREIERYRPFFVEDPLRAEGLQSYATLRRRTGVPLAAGEQCASKWELRPLIDGDLVDHIRLDPALAGGPTEARKVAGWCEAHHIDLAPHMANGPVLLAACLQLDLACPNVSVQELAWPPGTILPDVFPQQPKWEEGYLLAPTLPGLGLAFNRTAARAHAGCFEPVELPHLRRRDGSFTNW